MERKRESWRERERLRERERKKEREKPVVIHSSLSVAQSLQNRIRRPERLLDQRERERERERERKKERKRERVM